MHLFHITTRAAWTEAQRTGTYRPPSLATEGYIHLSTEHQWRGALARFIAGQRELVLLVIDPERLSAPVRYEPADGGVFPHLYGALPPAAVIEIRSI